MGTKKDKGITCVYANFGVGFEYIRFIFLNDETVVMNLDYKDNQNSCL